MINIILNNNEYINGYKVIINSKIFKENTIKNYFISIENTINIFINTVNNYEIK